MMKIAVCVFYGLLWLLGLGWDLRQTWLRSRTDARDRQKEEGKR